MEISRGADAVPCSLLNDCAEMLSQPQAKIMNNSFKSECFPEVLELSKVVPTFKMENFQLVNNFRPIKVQTVFTKLFEIVFAFWLLESLKQSATVILSLLTLKLGENFSVYVTIRLMFGKNLKFNPV